MSAKDVEPWALEPPPDEDDQARAGRAQAVVDVDRAVTRALKLARGDISPPIFRVPGAVASELGWDVCACGRGIEPGGGVSYRGELLHPECAAVRLEIAA